MSAAPSSGAAPAAKNTASPDKNALPSKDGKPAAALEEDDEFEDFPVESAFDSF
jgi:26 proteasome complex subunit DSS1